MNYYLFQWPISARSLICLSAVPIFLMTMLTGCHALNPKIQSVAATAQIAAPIPRAPSTHLRTVAYLGAPVVGSDLSADPENACRTIDLTTALQLAGIDNPTINLAREQVREALANQLGARSLLLPNVNVGGNFRLHRGALQDDPGFLRFPSSQSLLVGAGAGAIGAGNVAIPGVWLFANLSDVVYAPAVANQQIMSRRFDAESVRNNVFLDVCATYLDLVSAEARFELLQKSNAELNEIVKVTASFAKTGEGAPADANRALANAELIRRQLRETEGDVSSASARLSRLLNVDPLNRLRTPGGQVEPFRIINEELDSETLVRAATESRPELVARAASLGVAETQVRQERVRPWLPLVAVGYSSGFFGGGSSQTGNDFGPLSGRSDLSVLAVWNFQNLGIGNCARVSQARAVAGEAFAAYGMVLNQIRREVIEAQAAARAAARQMNAARVALADAEEGFRLEADRIKRGQGRPIEALDSFRQLNDARLELLRTVIAFDVAQLRLLTALGQPALQHQN